MEKKYKIVKIIWEDSNIYHHQLSIENDDFDLTEVETIGFLIQENKEKIVLARDIFEKENDARGIIVVSKKDIIERKYL